MGKIFCLMGKSATGKDTIYKQLLLSRELELLAIVPYTTRPIRDGERDGEEYHFVNEQELVKLRNEMRIIEERSYDTIHGQWHYFMAEDGQIDLQNHNYLYIGTLESFLQVIKYFGEKLVIPLYIDLDDGIRLQRALDRERRQDVPKYAEMCRRYLADLEDFSEQKIKAADINQRFKNECIKDCLAELSNFIKLYL